MTRGEIKRLMIFMPPRHGKSEQTTVRYPVWRLERNPQLQVIIAAYNQFFANKFSRKARRIAARRMVLAGDRNAVEEWETQAGGGLRVVGVGGGVTGQGADLCIIDDPVKNREEAESPVYREKVWDWYTDDLYTRLEPGAAVVLIQTRWHVDDLAGRILKSDDAPNWTVINLPAEAEDGDPLGREVGEALCPERYDKAALADIRRVLQSAYAALYQQRPVPAEGAVFKWPWFESHKYFDGGDFYTVGGKIWPYNQCWHAVIMDPAGGISTSADYTAIGSFAVTPDRHMLFVRLRRERIPWEDILGELKHECNLMRQQGRGVEYAGIENAFLQSALIRLGNKMDGMPAIRGLNPNLGEGKGKSAFVRSLPAVTMAEGGRIWIPEKDWDWVETFKQESLVFIGSDKERNDIIAVLSYMAVEVERGADQGNDMAFSFPVGGRGRR